jgi:hypothetical protein
LICVLAEGGRFASAFRSSFNLVSRNPTAACVEEIRSRSPSVRTEYLTGVDGSVDVVAILNRRGVKEDTCEGCFSPVPLF